MYTDRELARFWKHVQKTNDCWEWTGATASIGYGHLSMKRHGRWVSQYAHRMAYELYVGPIPEGYHVCHHCDNPPCVRPDHLFVGTAKDNMQDRDRKGRAGWQQPGAKFGPKPRLEVCRSGHPLTPENRGVTDRCHACLRERAREHYWRKGKLRRQQRREAMRHATTDPYAQPNQIIASLRASAR